MNKTCVITGATSGIGEAVAMQMAEKGWQLAIIGRNEEKGESLLTKLQSTFPGCSAAYFTADLSDVSSIKSVASEISSKLEVIDVLINNAGGVFSEFELTADGVEKTMANNHLNFFVLTLSLLPNLKRSADARVISVSSATHYKTTINFESFKDPGKYFILRAYAQSKLANVLFTYALARRLEGTTVSAVVLHPGVVGTPIGGKSNKRLHRLGWKVFSKFRKMITPAESARTYVYLATDTAAKQHNAAYFHAGKLQASSDESYNEEIQERLWAWSEDVTGLKL